VHPVTRLAQAPPYDALRVFAIDADVGRTPVREGMAAVVGPVHADERRGVSHGGRAGLHVELEAVMELKFIFVQQVRKGPLVLDGEAGVVVEIETGFVELAGYRVAHDVLAVTPFGDECMKPWLVARELFGRCVPPGALVPETLGHVVDPGLRLLPEI